MRAHLQAKSLADGLKFVGKLDRTAIPILQAARIEVGGDAVVRIATTDLDVLHTVELVALNGEDGVTVVDRMLLCDFVRKLPPTAGVTIEQAGAGPCVLTYWRGRLTLPTLDPADWPQLDPPGPETAAFVLPQGEARRLVTRLRHAIGIDRNRPYLHGVYLHRQIGKLAAVATNGRVLAKILINLNPGDLKAIIPAKAIASLARIADHGDVAVRATVTFACGAWASTSKLIDGAFPDYAQDIPAPSADQAEIVVADLASAIKRHRATTTERFASVGLSWNGDGTLKTTSGSDGVKEIAATTSGKARVAAQAADLLEALKALNAKTVTINHSHEQPLAPILITTGEPALMVIQPLVAP
jgi:DNA polymerase III subunit beta